MLPVFCGSPELSEPPWSAALCHHQNQINLRRALDELPLSMAPLGMPELLTASVLSRAALQDPLFVVEAFDSGRLFGIFSRTLVRLAHAERMNIHTGESRKTRGSG